MYRPLFGYLPCPHKGALIWAVIIVAISALSIFWAYDFDTTLNRTVKLVLACISFAVTISIAKNLPLRSAQNFLFLLPWATGICALLVIIELIFDFPIYQGFLDKTDIRTSELNKPAVLCALMLFPSLAIIMTTNMINATKNRSKIIWIAGISLSILVGVAAFLSDSEVSKLAFIIGFFFAILFPVNWRPAWIIAMIGFCALVFSSPWTVQFAYDAFVDKVNDAPFVGSGDGHGAQRLEIWDMVARKSLDKVLYGHGTDSSRAIVFNPKGDYFAETFVHPHNFALQLWLEFGLIGALIAMISGVYPLWKISKLDTNTILQKLTLAGMVACFCVAAFGYSIWNSWFIGLITIIIASFVAIYNKGNDL